MPSPPLAGIPANLILGQAPARRLLIERLLRGRPPGESWAVLDNADTGLSREAGPDLALAALADACVCCNAVTMKVALTRLLREARPARLLILPSGQARIPQLLRLLSDRWLAPVLQLRATMAAVEAPMAGLAWAGLPAVDGESPLAHAQLVAVMPGKHRPDDGFSEACAAFGRLAPHARFVAAGEVNVRLLDEPGAAPRPFFRGDS